MNPDGGGPVEGVKQLQEPLKSLGINIEIACCDMPDDPWLAERKNVTIHSLGTSKNKYGYTPKLVPWLRNNAKHYDALIIEGLWQYHGLAVRKALKNTKIPYFVFTHGMLDPWFKYTYPLKHMKKWAYWPWGEYRVLRDAKSVIFTCEEERLLARKSFWLYKVKESVASYGTSSPPANKDKLKALFFDIHKELKSKRIILFLSRIHEKKGCDMLLEALAIIAKQDTRVHLIMAGPDQTGWSETLKIQAEKLGISHRITWTGMLQGEVKWGAYYAAEVFCLPSHQENFGVVVAEALACGKPVLISNKVNIWREIEADAAGFIDEDTVEGTVRNLGRWLALDVAGYSEMCEHAKQCFSSRFQIQRAAARLVDIIREHGQ